MKKLPSGELAYDSGPKGPKARRPASNKPWSASGTQTRAQADRTTAEQMRLDSRPGGNGSRPKPGNLGKGKGKK